MSKRRAVIIISDDESDTNEPPQVAKKPRQSDANEQNETKENDKVQKSKNEEKETKRICPTRIEASPTKIVNIPDDKKSDAVFEKFLTVCRLKCKTWQMEVILKKANGYYQKAKPEYKKSLEFQNLVNQKTESIDNDPRRIFVYIKDVVDEIKIRRMKCKSTTEVSTDQKTSHKSSEVEKKAGRENGEVRPDIAAIAARAEAFQKERKIRKLSHAMKKVDKVIKRLEEREVNFDDDNDSAYIKLERYKDRFCKIHKMLCELTGDVDPVKMSRRIEFSGTEYPEINRCIEKFVNKTGQFPDFHDILKLVKEVETTKNLKPEALRRIAQSAFLAIGRQMQKKRQYESWDAVSDFLKDKYDPAEEDPELHARLQKNSEESAVRIQEVIDNFVEKQEVGKLEPEEVPDDVADKSEGSEKEDGEENEEEEEEDEEENDFVEKVLAEDDNSNLGSDDDEQNNYLSDEKSDAEKSRMSPVEEREYEKENYFLSPSVFNLQPVDRVSHQELDENVTEKGEQLSPSRVDTNTLKGNDVKDNKGLCVEIKNNLMLSEPFNNEPGCSKWGSDEKESANAISTEDKRADREEKDVCAEGATTKTCLEEEHADTDASSKIKEDSDKKAESEISVELSVNPVESDDSEIESEDLLTKKSVNIEDILNTEEMESQTGTEILSECSPESEDLLLKTSVEILATAEEAVSSKNDPEIEIFPEKKTEDIGPEEDNSEILPEKKTEHIGPEEDNNEILPEKKTEHIGPEEDNNEILPEKKTEHIGPEEDDIEILPEKKNEHIDPEKDDIEILPEKKTEHIGPEEDNILELDSKSSQGAISSKDDPEIEIFPEKKTEHIGPEEDNIEILPEKKTEHIGPEEDDIEILPEKKTEHIGPEEDNIIELDSKSSQGAVSSKDDPEIEILPEKKIEHISPEEDNIIELDSKNDIPLCTSTPKRLVENGCKSAGGFIRVKAEFARPISPVKEVKVTKEKQRVTSKSSSSDRDSCSRSVLKPNVGMKVPKECSLLPLSASKKVPAVPSVLHISRSNEMSGNSSKKFVVTDIEVKPTSNVRIIPSKNKYVGLRSSHVKASKGSVETITLD